MSDEALEDVLHGSQAMRRFIDIELVREAASHATTPIEYPLGLEMHNLTQTIFERIHGHVEKEGLPLDDDEHQ